MWPTNRIDDVELHSVAAGQRRSLAVWLTSVVRRPNAFAVFLLACALASMPGHAAGLSARQKQEISEIVTASLETNQLPGLSVAVTKDGLIWSAGFGKADLEQGVPVTAQSMFRTASVAKWFTATAAMRLV